MTNKIKVILKNVYGHDLVYPVCDEAKLLATLTGKKTFSKNAIETIKQLGYEIETIQQNWL